LQEIITTVISYGVIGYPFIMPGAVGGDIILPNNHTYVNHHLLETPPLPEKELYIRWLQLATFLPVLRFTHLPTDFKDETVTEVAKELLNVRQKTVVPLLLKYNKDAMNEGLPLVRPLWMLDPQNAACQNITDEFAIGDELIVAPILQKGEIQREIYLPKGVWKDMVSGALRKGNVWLHNHKVPLEKVVYFQKMPDNTRF
jgi:alpha-glucosidase (family GH31 glycosyl hydrolase)